jgi:hypothetical protein
MKDRDLLEDLAVCLRIILKWNLGKVDMNHLVRHRDCYKHGQQTSGSIKTISISLLDG